MSILSVALLGGLVGVFVGAALGRYVDPQRQQNLEHNANLKKAQEELISYRQQVKDHFAQTASLIQTLADSAKAVHDHFAIDALKLSGLDLRPASTEEQHEYNLAKLASGQNIEPPKDYAQKNKNAIRTLSEEYGLHDYDEPTKTLHN